MKASQKKTLRHHYPDLVSGLYLTADLIAKLIQSEIFNEDMIEEIRSEKITGEQIQKMLYLLTRRGPRAFDKFLLCIDKDHQWLAEDLRKTHQTINQKIEMTLKKLKSEVDKFVHEEFGQSMRLREEDIKQIRRFLDEILKHANEDDCYSEMTLKTLERVVDIYVHEEFGQSKRISEGDKKKIRRFLYKKLKHANEDDLHNDPNSRRGSIQSDTSEHFDPIQEESEVNDNFQKLLRQLYSILSGEQLFSNREITVEMIENKAYELNKKVEDLQNDQQNCLSMLGLKNCKFTLQEALEKNKETNQDQFQELEKYQERVDKLEQQRNKLEEEMINKEKDLQKCINDLANEKHEHEKSKDLIANLKAECARLDSLHHQHLEKQQTLMTLKSMVKELKPITKDNHDHHPSHYGLDKVDGNTIHLPKLTSKPNSMKASRLSRKSMVRDSSHDTHYEYQRSKLYGTGSPWKY